LKDGVSEPAAASDHGKKGAQIFKHYRHALNGYAAKLSEATLAAVRADSRVRFVAPGEELFAAAKPPPPENPQVTQRSVERIDANLSSTRSGDGRGSVPIDVAVLDSGIVSSHPDLNVAGGTDCTDSGWLEDTYGDGQR
jgi:hypothetical protein